MKISTRGRYGLLIMIYLANNYYSNKYVSLKEISDKENISIKYLEKIMLNFNKTDYLISSRGNDGGYKLKYPPEAYNIKEILEVLEGNLDLVSCTNSDNFCLKRDNCLTYPLWMELERIVNEYLESKTLKDYVKETNL